LTNCKDPNMARHVSSIDIVVKKQHNSVRDSVGIQETMTKDFTTDTLHRPKHLEGRIVLLMITNLRMRIFILVTKSKKGIHNMILSLWRLYILYCCKFLNL